MKWNTCLWRRVAEELPGLQTGLQRAGDKANPTALSHPLADLHAPMRVEIVHAPVEAFQERELGGNRLQVADPIDAGAGRSEVPNDVSGGDAERRQQGPGAVAGGLELSLFDGAGPGQSCGVLPLEDLHPGLLIAGQNQAALLVKTRGIEVQLADGFGLGVEVGVVTVEPVLAAVGFVIGFAQDAADGAATHVAVVCITQDIKGDVVKTPGRVGLLVIVGLATGEYDDVESFLGGKISGGDRSVERLGDRSTRGRHRVPATDPQCGGRSRGRQQPVGWWVARVVRPSGRSDNETPSPVAWIGRGRGCRA